MIKKGSCLMELADNLDAFLDKIQNEPDAMQYYECYYRSLLLYSSQFNEMNYQVTQKEDIVTPYLLTNWAFYNTAEDNYRHLRNLSRTIRTLFEPSSTIGITESSVHQIMKHIECRFGYCSSVLKTEPLRILITNDGFKEGNSLVMSLQIEAGADYLSQNDAIILTHLKDNISPEFVFLHELGHILHLRLTRQYATYTPPKSFEIIMDKLFSRAINKPEQVKAELFAECFAMAALYNSEYSHYDHINYIRDEHKMLCFHYFKVLLNTYEENEMGKLLWDELLVKLETREIS